LKAQEVRRTLASKAREAALAEARTQSLAQVQQARAVIEQDKQVAKTTLETEAGRLATEIIRIVLEPSLARAGR
jgi:F0F1-type ATP synthase membrane subunit b/b'